MSALSRFADRLFHYRLGFFVVGALLVGIVASLPLTLSDAIFNLLSLPSGRLYPLIGEVGQSLTERPIHMDIAVTALDEASLTATLQVTAHRNCAVRSCDNPLQVKIYSLLTDANPFFTDQDILPPSVVVQLAPGAPQVDQTVQLPVHGNPIRYPYDTYDLWVGISLWEDQNGAVAPLPAETAGQQLRLAVREQLTRLLMQRPVQIGPDRLNPVERSIYLATAGALTFERPVYLRVLALVLILLIAATATGAVLLRPLQDLFIGAGSIVIGVWGVRTVLVPGFPQYTTAVDLSLSIIILFLLGAIVTRLLLFFHERGQLPWSAARRSKSEAEEPAAPGGAASR